MRTLLFFLVAAPLVGQAPVSYEIRRATSPITIDARLDEPAWRQAEPVSPFNFTWWTQGEKEPTTVKMLWDDENLYVGYLVHDKHISAYVTQRHGPVSRDDCVEIFIAPNPNKVTNYYTFEINAIGAMLNRARVDWWTGPPTWEPDGVEYRTTFHGMPKKDESPDDTEWVVEMKVPLRNFARDAANMPPRDGDVWKLNLNRLGGKTNPQYSSWSPIPTPKPSFHTPTAFGPVTFVNKPPAGAGAAQQGGNPLERTPQVVADGRNLFNRNCTMCHGVDGAVGDRAPAMAGTRRFLRNTDESLYEAVRHGISGTMMPGTKLPDGDVWRIVAYIRSLRATAFDDFVAGDAANGRRIFETQAGCAKCHMVDGRGGVLGPDLSDVGGSRRLAQIREALVEEPPHIPRGYQPATITLASGQRIEGLIRNENNFSLQVLGFDNKLHMLTREGVRVDYRDKSLMPRGWDKKLSADEMQDLLAYLSRQARSRRAQAANPDTLR